jgi:outer membrane protein assembly factor BamB
VYYAFDIESGSIVWSYDFNEDVGLATFHGDPLLVDDLVITGTESLLPPEMRAFDRQTGRVVWKRADEWSLTRSDVIGFENLAIGRNQRGELVALDSRSGEKVWHLPHQGETFRPDVGESPAVAESSIIFSAPDGFLYRVAADSGSVIWRLDLGCDVSTSVAVSGDDVYVGCSDGQLFHVSASDGDPLATLALGQPLEGRLLILPDRLVVPGGRAWFGTIDRNLAGVIWERTDLTRLSVVQPIIWKGALLTGTGDGRLLGLSPEDGRTVWTTQLEGSIRGLGTHNDILLVGTIGGTVYALRAER